MLDGLQAPQEGGWVLKTGRRKDGLALTNDFKATIRARAQRDPAFRQELLREGVACIINGDLDTGKAMLRDYVNATVGFPKLEHRLLRS